MTSLRWLYALALVFALCAFASSAFCQETAEYPNGTSGLKAGTIPPPGRYWLMYNRIYQTTRLMDANGDAVTGAGCQPLGMDVTGYANVHAFSMLPIMRSAPRISAGTSSFR
jgi:hypothetical protein